jgi:hypothetical protein
MNTDPLQVRFVRYRLKSFASLPYVYFLTYKPYFVYVVSVSGSFVIIIKLNAIEILAWMSQPCFTFYKNVTLTKVGFFPSSLTVHRVRP